MRTKSPAHRYTEQDVERALQAAVIASGNTRHASELLREAGYRVVPHRTLHTWITGSHQERYRGLQQQLRDELNSRRADEYEALSKAYNEMQWEIIDRLKGKLPEMKGGELAQAANKFAIAAAVATDKSRLYRSEPTEISVTRDTQQLLRFLAQDPRWKGAVSVNPVLLEGEATEESAEGMDAEAPWAATKEEKDNVVA